MNEQLTNRWFPLKYHKEQDKLWNSLSKFNRIEGGRRTYKTELAKRKIVLEVLNKEKTFCVYVMETKKQLELAIWTDILYFFPKNTIFYVDHNSFTIQLRNKSVIKFMTLKTKDWKKKSNLIDFIVFDECGKNVSYIWDKYIFPKINGTVWCINSTINAYKYNNVKWDLFHWTSLDFLSEEQIELVKKSLSKEIFEIEYLRNQY